MRYPFLSEHLQKTPRGAKKQLKSTFPDPL